MWLEEAEEIFKGYLPFYVLIVLPMFIMMSPINPVSASYEFPVYRMQHFDLQGDSHGCRSASVNLEARSLLSWTTSRHCVMVGVKDLTIEHFRNIRTKAGALLIVFPEDVSLLSLEEKQNLILLEDEMLSQEVTIPVYFITATPEMEKILIEISSSVSVDDKAKTAAETLFSSVAANGYQIVINPRNPTARQDIQIATIQGNLVGVSHDPKAPTIAIVAHYDSFGIAPDLSFGADSNGSGVVVLLELMRLFSLLYSDSKTHAKYNIIFLLSGGGKFNYQGSKKWLDDQMDSSDGSLIQDASYVMCLDTLASSNLLYMHVSKPPKEGSPTSAFFKELKSASNHYAGLGVDGIHKKINLADDLLAWEHEKFSIARFPAFTLSSLKSHKDVRRATVVDVNKNLDMDQLVKNTQIIAEALVSQVYNVSGNEIFGGTWKIEQEHLESWMNILSSYPRSAQLLSNKDSAIVHFLKDSFSKYLRDVRISYTSPDKRDPDFMFYDVTKSNINIYSVKPAVFDLILTLIIIAYLGTVYVVIQNFSGFYQLACNITSRKLKVN